MTEVKPWIGDTPTVGLRRPGIYWVAMELPQPPLPRPPADEENLSRLRKEAAARMEREEAARPIPAPVYGGPPIPRRWTVRGILMLVVGALAAIAAALFGYRQLAPVYGGPPAPVYGGPPPEPSPQPKPPENPSK